MMPFCVHTDLVQVFRNFIENTMTTGLAEMARWLADVRTAEKGEQRPCTIFKQNAKKNRFPNCESCVVRAFS